MIKKDINIITKNGINYLSENGRLQKHKPWLGDLFSFLYDRIMEKSIFPKKFNASYEKHLEFLQEQFTGIHKQTILELATGSGNAVDFLPNDNLYTGTDISPGLLKIARKKFSKIKFMSTKLFVCSVEELPFDNGSFDLCICNLSINFFPELQKVLNEVARILKQPGFFFVSVPVPERHKSQQVIRGKLFSENELKQIFQTAGFQFTPYTYSNGAILYFKAIKT